MLTEICHNCHTYLIYKPFYDLGLKHVFTTRPDAMGFFKGIDTTTTKQNYDNIKDIFQCEGTLHFMKQIHSTFIKDVDTDEFEPHSLGQLFPNCDGLLTQQTEKILISTYADCIPLLVFDKQQKIQVNIHSGWRSTLNGILDNALTLLIQDYKSKPEDILILSGPHLLKEDFEVQADVLQLFNDKFPQIKNLVIHQDNRTTIDLNQVNLHYTQKHHIPKENIVFADISTLTDKRMHSFRKDKEQFQQMALVSCLID